MKPMREVINVPSVHVPSDQIQLFFDAAVLSNCTAVVSEWRPKQTRERIPQINYVLNKDVLLFYLH